MRTRKQADSGFTLVELLVVIGIIALLIAVLLPVLGRARDKANMVACLSNIRQIGIAFRMYAGDNKDWCPLAAPLSFPDRVGDWIHWQGGVPVGTGLASSGIAPYLGGGKGTSAKNTALEKVLRCPSDRLEDRASFRQYAYSYTMNIYFDPSGNFPAIGGKPIRFSTTKNASEKILLAEESEVTINDGYWVPGVGPQPEPQGWMTSWDWLSIRHDNSVKENSERTTNSEPLLTWKTRGLKGVAVFADGHADFITRFQAHHPYNVLPRR